MDGGSLVSTDRSAESAAKKAVKLNLEIRLTGQDGTRKNMKSNILTCVNYIAPRHEGRQWQLGSFKLDVHIRG